MPPPPSSCPRYVLDALCAVDVAVRRRLAYAEADGTVTFDRAAIRARYRASGWLHADAACCAPVELVALLAAGSPGYRVALCLRASLRAVKLRAVARACASRAPGRTDATRAALLCGGLLLALHWAACLWYTAVATQDGDSAAHASADTWAYRSGAYAKGAGAQYVASLHAAVALLCFGAGGSGGASLDPRTPSEQALAVAFALGGALALALLFAAVARAWDAVAVGFAEAKCTRRLARVEARMGAMRLPGAIRARVRDYYTHLWRRNRTLQEDDELFSSLPVEIFAEHCFFRSECAALPQLLMGPDPHSPC